MAPIDLLLSKLPDAKRCGRGYKARCPAHDDRNPSLSINEGDAGRSILYCHAGCTPEAITSALGLRLADLMPKKTETPKTHRPGATPALKGLTVFHAEAQAVASLQQRHGRYAALWTYRNAEGEPVGMVVRWNLADGGKEIRPVSRRAGKTGGWTISAMHEPRPIYHLQELMARPGDPVYITEGEKAADATTLLGLLTVTSAGGAKAAAMTDWSPLSGRQVVIIPDADKAGAEYAANVAAILTQLTPPARVLVVRLRDAWHDLPDGGDMADVMGCGEDPDAIKAKLAALVEGVEPETLAESPSTVERYKTFPVGDLPGPLRAFVQELSAATGNDPACAALAALVVLAGVIGNRVAAQVKRGWIEPAILWGAIVARSGTTKSAVLKLATRPLVDIYKEAHKLFVLDLAAYEGARQIYEANRDRWRTAHKKGAAVGDPPIEPEASILGRRRVSMLWLKERLALTVEG
jgi:hypothetical protein